MSKNCSYGHNGVIGSGFMLLMKIIIRKTGKQPNITVFIERKE